MGFWFLYLMASVLLINTEVMSSPFLTKRSAPTKGPIIDDKAVNSRLARQWFTLDPDAQEVLSEVDGCETSTGEFGICQSPIICALYGGQRRSTSGSSQGCSFGSSCCISAATTCGRTTRLNNTYWESPSKVSSVSSCSLTIRLPDSIPVCQVRLDFISFSIAQPNSESMCTTDTFAVAGAANKVPTICGDNDDQHMYLTTQSTESNIQLLFNFGQSGIARSWKIKVDMLPCGSNYLAPSNCLQYFTETTGSVSSFNWKDTTSLRTRQLAHQDYSICFRSELIDDVDESSSLCLTPCTIFQSDTAFSVSGSTEGSQRSVADCNNDYVLIEGGYDPSEKNDLGLPKTLQDRYCGSQFSMKQSATISGRICTNYKTFKITYRTNGDETSTANVDRTGMGNQGFCLSFKQTLDA